MPLSVLGRRECPPPEEIPPSLPAPPPPPPGPTSGPSPPAPGLEGAEHQEEEEEERWVEDCGDCGSSISDVKLVERGRGGPVLRADVPAPPMLSLFLLLLSFSWIRTRRLLMYTPAKTDREG